jgi:peptide/nickel transport system ATP-binding protein
MEKGPVSKVFENPTNPYTQVLLAAIPNTEDDQSLMPIPGQIPDLINIPSGCIFADRCEFAEPECQEGTIEMDAVGDDTHQTRCRRWETAVDDPIEAGTAEKVSSNPGDVVLEIDNAKKYYGKSSYLDRVFGSEPPVKAVDGVSFEIRESEALGLVGESGCGKSTLGECLLKLQDLTEGSISYRGRPLQSLSNEEINEFRSEVQIVFQNPRSSLNPQRSVYQTIARPIQKFTDLDTQEQQQRVIELLNQVELGPEFANRYPDELSGGEQQRVAIARAFAANPSVVVLDEPLSALDVSVKASLLSLLDDLRAEYGVAYLLISHDLSVVHYLSDRVAVMYLGSFVETGSKKEVFQPPHHPYTHALLSAVPTPDPNDDVERIHLSGDVPSARDPPTGCRFHTRCPKYIGEKCEQVRPELESKDGSDSHYIACHLDVDDMNEEV